MQMQIASTRPTRLRAATSVCAGELSAAQGEALETERTKSNAKARMLDRPIGARITYQGRVTAGANLTVFTFIGCQPSLTA